MKERKFKMQSQINVIMGPTFSGKTTVLQKILSQNPQTHRIVTTTTRPPRLHEQNGRDYYFVTNREALIDRDQQLQIAPRSYHVANHKVWTYYLAAQNLKQLEQTNFLILDYAGYLELEAYLNQHPELNIQLHGYLLDTDLRVIFQRIANSARQNENPKETLRRLYDDTFNAFNISTLMMQQHHITKLSAEQLLAKFTPKETN